MKKKIEILSPAGSYESLMAAIAAGADAVYVGGCKFGARAFANNLSADQLLEAIDYVHLHGKRIYLTVNTLLKESEITQELYDYLAPLYQQGLDAVIVQDLGVIQFVQTYFPDLPIHASTQMTITNVLGARFLEKEGISRVVTARELRVDEIQEIAAETELEIESFVHGALCYCYSGQCLYSSLLGGRSGNRGQCAQPCRLPYEVGNTGNKSYVLSLKDICTLDTIPELLAAGITSLKIEGRMKKPEYVAAVTGMYRKYVDLFLQKGKKEYCVTQEDKAVLLDLYNRGGFHPGYYHTQNGREMVSLNRSSHAGVEAVKVMNCQGRSLIVKALIPLHKGDVMELPGQKHDYTLGQGADEGDTLTICLAANTKIAKGSILNRVRNEQLLQLVRSGIMGGKLQEKINGKLILSPENPAILRVQYKEFVVEVQGTTAEEAVNQPLSIERVEKQLRKTGTSTFIFDHLEVVIEGSLFMTMQQLNDLRRKGIEALEQAVCNSCRRTLVIKLSPPAVNTRQVNASRSDMPFIAYVETLEQLKAVLEFPYIRKIYIDSNITEMSYKNSKLHQLVRQCHSAGILVYYALPHIFRKDTRALFHQYYEEFSRMNFDGMIIRNYESYEFLAERSYQKPIVLDYNVYTFNNYSKDFWKRKEVEHDTVPLELNYRELKALCLKRSELVAYGYLPMMVSAQCIQKTMDKCNHKQGRTTIKDRYQKEFVVKNCCDYCYNIIYNSAPLLLLDQSAEIEKLNAGAIRLHFTLEDASQTAQVLQAFKDTFINKKTQVDFDIEFTRGHFKRGIK